MCRKFLVPSVLTVAIASFGATTARADFQYSVSESDDGQTSIFLDDSHDLVLIGVDGNRVDIQVLMFDPAEFSAVPSLDNYSLQELEDMAADEHNYDDRSLNELSRILIFCGGGNDDVRTDPEFPLPLHLFGEHGEDRLEGGAARDRISGGDDGDDLFGRGGDDDLFGGTPGSDGTRDIFQGDGGSDFFLQFYRLNVSTLRTRSGSTYTRTVRVNEETIVDFRSGEQDEIESYQLP